jgi:subtilisin family serine protease
MNAAASSDVVSHEPVMAPMADADALGNARACKPFDEGSLAGRIPLIERGDCTFTVKLNNAAAAGAQAAVVYNSATPATGAPDDIIIMNVDDGPSIPGLFIGRTDGLRLKELIATLEDLQVQLRFPNAAGLPNAVSSFSSRGPSIDLRIKPDLLATGSTVYTAAVQAPASECELCDPSGYLAVAGTSFSAPITAGAAAVLKAARPGLTGDEYRSLLINSASPFRLADGAIAPVMSAGAGMLNLKNAVSSTLAAAPVSLSFSSGGGTLDQKKPLRLKNLSADPVEYALAVESANDAKLTLPAESVTLEPGATQTLDLAFTAADLAPGAYEGFVKITNKNTSAESRIPYWYAVQGSVAGAIALLRVDPSTVRAGDTVRVWFRVHDKAGLVLAEPAPVAVPVSGGGSVVSLAGTARTYPNSWLLTYRTGPTAGPNVFTLRIGDESFTYQLTTGN